MTVASVRPAVALVRLNLLMAVWGRPADIAGQPFNPPAPPNRFLSSHSSHTNSTIQQHQLQRNCNTPTMFFRRGFGDETSKGCSICFWFFFTLIRLSSTHSKQPELVAAHFEWIGNEWWKHRMCVWWCLWFTRRLSKASVKGNGNWIEVHVSMGVAVTWGRRCSRVMISKGKLERASFNRRPRV